MFFVNSLVVQPGAHSYTQQQMLADFSSRIAHLPSSGPTLEKTKAIFEKSDITARHLELTIEELDRQRQEVAWQPIVKQAILSLAGRALERTIAAGLRPEACEALIVVASHYDGFPNASRRLSEAFGFRPDTLFFDLGGLGCGGANHGLQLAHLLLETRRCRTVCVVTADVLGTHARTRRHAGLPSISQIVAEVLPSDGAAAMVLAREPGVAPVFSYRAFELRLRSWADSGGYMVGGTGDDGEPYGNVGKEIRTRLLAESADLLTPDVHSPIFIHGGGPALVRLLAETIPQLARTAELSAQVLGAHGNMSSPTVLFVLSRAIEQGFVIGPKLRLLTFGPGVYTSLGCFDGTESRAS